MAIEVFAPAKVNLALHVTGRRAGGYHLLDSIVAFADIGDRLRFDLARDLSLSVTGPFAAGVPTDGANLIVKAATLMQPEGQGARIVLEKNLPHGGGIGGGSSDAATTLRALSRLWQVALPDPSQVLALGADVPVCLSAPVPQRMRGIGEDIAPLPPLPEMYLTLVNPAVPVPTGQVFAKLAEVAGTDNPGLAPLPPMPDLGAFTGWLTAQRNDLEAPATMVAPVIAEALAALRAARDCRLARMSGSGSTVFGLFDTAQRAERAAAAIADARPGWWVRATRLLAAADQGR